MAKQVVFLLAALLYICMPSSLHCWLYCTTPDVPVYPTPKSIAVGGFYTICPYYQFSLEERVGKEGEQATGLTLLL